MKPSTLVVTVLLLISVLFLVTAYSQEDMKFIDPGPFEPSRRPPAIFHHDEHNETANIEDCSVCHHVYEDGQLVKGESSEGQPCSDCHELKGSGQKPGLRLAFHLRCQGCHQEEKKGPVMCGECHVRGLAVDEG
jgi:hypothetical protein